MSSDFLNNYITATIEASKNEHEDNYDSWRFGPSPLVKQNRHHWLKRSICKLLQKYNSINEDVAKVVIAKAVAHIVPNLTSHQWLYTQLVDDESRELLIQLQLYRAIGAKYVKLSVNNPNYWAKLKSIEALIVGAETVDLGFLGWKAYKMHLNGFGYPLQLFLRPPAVLTQLLLQQYRCQIANSTIEVEEGDVVLDCGGCYGETALYFAFKAGKAGKVFTFEFMPENLSILHRNMALNPDIAQCVSLVENPLWDNSGEKLYVEGSGPGTRVNNQSTDTNARQVETISIDDFVQRQGLDKLDFIKMDIEGAELRALKGGEKSILKFRPKLAISVYHRPEDFWVIPQYIASLGLGYNFAIRHFTIHQEETVLFAF